MAIAVPAQLDEDELVRQAAALDSRAEQLRAQARSLAQQAIDLRLAAERQRREPLVIQRKPVGVERDARLLARLGDLLGQIGPCKSSHLAEHLNLPKARVSQALLVLEKSGVAKRSGIRRGTVWGLADDEDLNGHTPTASARTLVLDAGRKLDTFNIDMIDRELQMLTKEGIRRVLRELVAEGVFSEARDGHRKLYAFERPEAKPVNRPKHEPPEAKVIEMARRTPLPRRGGVVAGTRRTRSGSPVVNELLRELRDWPIVEITKHAHSFRFKIDGKTIASCSTTPGASALGETRRLLRNAGIDVRD